MLIHNPVARLMLWIGFVGLTLIVCWWGDRTPDTAVEWLVIGFLCWVAVWVSAFGNAAIDWLGEKGS